MIVVDHLLPWKIDAMSGVPGTGTPDEFLPRSITCSNELSLPRPQSRGRQGTDAGYHAPRVHRKDTSMFHKRYEHDRYCHDIMHANNTFRADCGMPANTLLVLKSGLFL
jgi:hypothetical protein